MKSVKLFSALQDKNISALGRCLPLSERTLVNVYRCGDKNVGDLKSSPALYFDALGSAVAVDILGYRAGILDAFAWTNVLRNARIIVGGGGLLNRQTFASSLHLLGNMAARGKKVVLWGVGDNSRDYVGLGTRVKYDLDLDMFPLVGVRDHGQSWRWVPCASCLAPELSESISVQREIGVVLHHSDIARNASDIGRIVGHFPVMHNDHESFEELIRFIGESEYILTSSYHAMYWGILLGRKVVVFPNSSKMFRFKYKVPAGSVSDYRSLMKRATRHTEALEDCRSRNIQFAEDAFDYLGL